MELRQLRYFRAVAETGTFTAAAEQAHVAQPALWKQVRDLERELGVVLFERAGRRVRLTANGGLLLERAVQVLDGAGRMAALAGDLKIGRSGQVVVACSPPHINRILAAAIREFGRDHPTVHVELREYPGISGAGPVPVSPFLSELRVGLADLAVAHGSDPEFETMHLYDIHVALLVADDHPWRRRRSVPIEQLRDVPLVVTPEGFASRRLLEDGCRQAGFEPLVERVSGSPFSLVAMGAQGAGVAVVADDVPPAAGQPWPRVRAGGAGLREGVYLHWRRTPPSAATEAFIATVRRMVG